MIDRPVRRYVKTRFLQNCFSKVDREFWLFRWLTISIVYILIAILYKLQRIVDDLVKEWMRCATTVHLVVLLWGKIRRSPRGLWGFLGLHSAFSSPRRGRAPRFVSLHSYSMPATEKIIYYIYLCCINFLISFHISRCTLQYFGIVLFKHVL